MYKIHQAIYIQKHTAQIYYDIFKTLWFNRKPSNLFKSLQFTQMHLNIFKTLQFT